MLDIREAVLSDIGDLHELYMKHLTQNPPTEKQEPGKWTELLETLLADPHYHLLTGSINGKVVSAVTLVIIRNLTHNMRPYSIIENVVTHYLLNGCSDAGIILMCGSKLFMYDSAYVRFSDLAKA
jgi:hypothetical protein